jgi:hypothetical protein
MSKRSSDKFLALDDPSSSSNKRVRQVAQEATQQVQEEEEEKAKWNHEHLQELDMLLDTLPGVETLLGYAHQSSPLGTANSSPTPTPLDNDNLRTAIRLFLCEWHATLGLPFVPRDLCDLIAAYAATPILHAYHIVEASGVSECGSRNCHAIVDLEENVFDDETARHWCIAVLALDSRVVHALDTHEWQCLYFPTLQDRYAQLSTEQLLCGVLYCSRNRTTRCAVTSTTFMHRLGGGRCDTNLE